MRADSVASRLLEDRETLAKALEEEEIKEISAKVDLNIENADVIDVNILNATFDSYEYPLSIVLRGDVTISDGQKRIVVELDGEGSRVTSYQWYVCHLSFIAAQVDASANT